MKFALPALKLPEIPEPSKPQLKELSKYWLDLSKLTFASLTLKFFEPEARLLGSLPFLTVLFGLTISTVFAIIGLWFVKEAEKR